MAALTVRCLTNLATPQKSFEFGVSSFGFVWPRRNSKHKTRNLKLTIGCGDESRTRIISFTRRALCYPIELRRNGGLGGIQTLTRSLQDFYALGYITSPRKSRVSSFELETLLFLNSKLQTRNSKINCWWLWVESNRQPRAYETLALFHLSYTAKIEAQVSSSKSQVSCLLT